MTDRETTEVNDTPIEKANLRPYALGVEGRPYPMMRKFANDSDGRIYEELGVLEDSNNPLTIHSELDYASVVGRAYRDMPSPGMLRIFLNGLRQREVVACPTSENPHGFKPIDPRRVEFMMGDPGAGKSFLANLHAKMRDKRGAILVDCGGRNLNELLYETALDYSAGQTVYDEINGRLAAGTMNPASVNLLRNALGSAFTQDANGRAAIDWEEVGISRIDSSKLEAKSKEIAELLNITEEDFSADLSAAKPELLEKLEQHRSRLTAESNALWTEAEHAREGALAAIRTVADNEGLGKGGNASINLTVNEGALIRAWREGRPPILDEYNKAKPGTDDQLQILWQVFNGEMDEHTVKGGGGKTFTFKKSEMPPNFFVTLTGNLTKDGYSTRSLSASAYQRLQPQYIEAPTPADLQHRICQKLTGMPVSTIYDANKNYWKAHKDEFTDYLIGMRKRGLSEEQQANIPSWQFKMLENWPNVLQASEQLAVFYDQWAQIIDPDSKIHATANKEGGEAGLVADDIDERYRDEVGMGLRRVMRHLDQAVLVNAEPISSFESKGVDLQQNFDEAPDVSLAEPDDVEKRYGTRLSQVILEDLDALSTGKDNLMTYLLQRAAEAGLFNKILEEGKTTGDHQISSLLDLDPELSKQLPENVELTHELLCNYLREKFNGIEGMDLSEAENEDIISPSKLEYVMTQLAAEKDIRRASNRSGVLYLPNEDPDTLSDQPLVGTVATESPLPELDNIGDLDPSRQNTYAEIRAEEVGLQGIRKLPAEDLVDASRLLVGLALPSISAQNLDALWNEYATNCEETSDFDSARKIAENQAPSGLATQLIQCKTKDENGVDRIEYLYVVHDSFTEKTLVTGTAAVTPALQEALEKNNVTYVDRTQAGAEDTIKESLKELFESKSDPEGANMSIERAVTNALSMRVIWEYTKEEVGANGRTHKVPVQVFSLPHQELLSADWTSPIVSETERGKDMENLSALLADREQYLEKSKERNSPFIATNSQDLDQLKHTVRKLTEAPAQQAAGQAR